MCPHVDGSIRIGVISRYPDPGNKARPTVVTLTFVAGNDAIPRPVAFAENPSAPIRTLRANPKSLSRPLAAAIHVDPEFRPP
jgi:hypothetical protein